MKKILIIFIVGLTEQFLYTLYLLAVSNRFAEISSLLMIFYMSAYLLLMNYAIKDGKAVILLITYAIACGFGNYLAMLAGMIK